MDRFKIACKGKQSVGALSPGVKEEAWHASTMADRSSLCSGFLVGSPAYNVRGQS